ncbi:transposase [Endozoicomonas ascidiicola]|uniref:transposase n=1 Tax=Endozoicomonas ascidiicola TaxID=1698521 RepID=UPI00082F9FE8|nr:transposase [Endozoicomonas ascidiicola]
MKLYNLLDSAKCYERIRELRWPDGVTCPRCKTGDITRQGKDESQPERQRYFCKSCSRKFDDLTLSVFAGHHQPLKIWVSCLHLMSLNVSNSQIAQELDLNVSDVQNMTRQLREAVCSKRPEVVLSGEVECDEVYIVAGHKGHSEAVKKKP